MLLLLRLLTSSLPRALAQLGPGGNARYSLVLVLPRNVTSCDVTSCYGGLRLTLLSKVGRGRGWVRFVPCPYYAAVGTFRQPLLHLPRAVPLHSSTYLRGTTKRRDCCCYRASFALNQRMVPRPTSITAVTIRMSCILVSPVAQHDKGCPDPAMPQDAQPNPAANQHPTTCAHVLFLVVHVCIMR